MSDGLDVGFVDGTAPGKWFRRWRERHREIDLIEHPLAPDKAVAALVNGDVRLLIGRDLTRSDEFHLIELYQEDVAVAAARGHVISAFDALTLADLEDETILQPAGVSPATLLDVVASGAGVALLPLPLARSINNRDVVLRPVIDAEPTSIGVSWRTDDDDPAVEEFIGILRGRSAASSRQPLAQSEASSKGKPAKPGKSQQKNTAREPAPGRARRNTGAGSRTRRNRRG